MTRIKYFLTVLYRQKLLIWGLLVLALGVLTLLKLSNGLSRNSGIIITIIGIICILYSLNKAIGLNITNKYNNLISVVFFLTIGILLVFRLLRYDTFKNSESILGILGFTLILYSISIKDKK